MPWNTGGIINICKKEYRVNCVLKSSTNTCLNLSGGPYYSGFSSGPKCTIYSASGCAGTRITVDSTGYDIFPFQPKSFKCPCM